MSDSLDSSELPTLPGEPAPPVDGATVPPGGVTNGAAGSGASFRLASGPGEVGTAADHPRIGGYQVTGRLGAGGMGTVWRAVQLSTRRTVALKLLGAGMFASAQARLRFDREVQLTARLQHPHIARVYESGLDQGAYFYAMELIEGLPLDRYVREKRLGRRAIVELMQTVCTAVQHAHQRGVIHRDLKPSNILVGGDDQPHVLDFGLAKALLQEKDGEDSDAGPLSIDGEVAGTPAFMSPEQAAGKTLDTRSDVYSLGVLLYRLLVGSSPHDLSGTNVQIMRRVIEDEVKRPRSVNAAIDRELEAVLLKALARDPEARYASAGDLARDLGNYLAGEPLTARVPTTAYFLRKRIAKYKAALSIAAGVALALTAMAIFSAVRVRQQRDLAVVSAAEAHRQEEIAREQSMRARDQQHLAELRAADGLVEQGQALELAYRFADAKGRYEQACGAYHTLGVSTLPADLGLWSAFRHSRPPLWSISLDSAAANTVSGPTTQSDGATQDLAAYWAEDGGPDPLPPQAVPATGPTTRPEEMNGVEAVRLAAVAFSPDGRLAVTGGMRQPLRIWDVQTARLVKQFAMPAGDGQTHPDGYTGNSSYVSAVAFSSDGRLFVSGGSDAAVRIWGPRGEIRTLRSHAAGVTGVAFLPGDALVASSGLDSRLSLFSAANGRLLRGMATHQNGVYALAVMPDGRILTGGGDGTVKIWTPDTSSGPPGFVTLTGPPPADGFAPEEPDPSGNRAKAGFRVSVASGHTAGVSSLAVFPDSEHFVSGGTAGDIVVWSMSAGRPVWMVHSATELPAGPVWNVAACPDGRRVLVAYSDATLRLYDIDSVDARGAQQVVQSFTGHTDAAYGVAIAPDGRRALSAGVDRRLALWDLGAGAGAYGVYGRSPAAVGMAGDRRCVTAVAVSPDGRMAVCGGNDSSLKICDTATWRQVGRLRGHTAGVNSIAFAHDGRHVLSCGSDTTVKLWDLWANQAESKGAADESIRTFHGHESYVIDVVFSPDDRLALSGGHDQIVKLWDVASGNLVRDLPGHIGEIRQVAFLPDGSRALSASLDKTLRLWDIRTGKTIRTFAHDRPVWCFALTSDGRRAFSGSIEGLVKLWDLDSGRELASWRAHTGYVDALAISPDGGVLMSSGRTDLAVRLWDIRDFPRAAASSSGEGPRELRSIAIDVNVGRHLIGELRCGFLNQGQSVWCAGFDQALQVWDLSWPARRRPAEEEAAACRAALARNPADAQALLGLSQWYELEGEFDWAAELLGRSGTVAPERRARDLWLAGADDAAHEAFQQLALQPNRGESEAVWQRFCAAATATGESFSTGFEPEQLPSGWAPGIGEIANLDQDSCAPGLAPNGISPGGEPSRTDLDNNALILAGRRHISTPDLDARAWHSLFDVELRVTPKTRLRYRLMPYNASGRHIGVDLKFSDGSNLCDSPARDTLGQLMHPREPRGFERQWTTVECPIGQWFAGKTIRQIFVGYVDPDPSDGNFAGAIDDLEIGEAPEDSK